MANVGDLRPGSPPEAQSAADTRFMQHALQLAEGGWGHVHPNPLVGAVVVREGEVVGKGYHAEYGGPHAEVVALRDAGALAEGATIYVTLEPCAHHGKTPPCTDAIIEAGIARVVYAVADPNDTASGGGDRLRAAGVEVVMGVEEEVARAQNAIFFHNQRHKPPFLALKFAMTLDARLAETPGRPTAITGPEAQRETHRLRAGFDAIMVGSGTVQADDPLLTVRGDLIPRRPPIRVVLDSDARLSPDSRLIGTIAEAPVVLICADDLPEDRTAELRERGAQILRVPRSQRGLDLFAALESLAEIGVESIFSEGGGEVGSALLEAGLVDRLYLFYSPKLFGTDAVPAFTGTFANQPEWERTQLMTFGPDLLVRLDRRG